MKKNTIEEEESSASDTTQPTAAADAGSAALTDTSTAAAAPAGSAVQTDTSTAAAAAASSAASIRNAAEAAIAAGALTDQIPEEGSAKLFVYCPWWKPGTPSATVIPADIHVFCGGEGRKWEEVAVHTVVTEENEFYAKGRRPLPSTSDLLSKTVLCYFSTSSEGRGKEWYNAIDGPTGVLVERGVYLTDCSIYFPGLVATLRDCSSELQKDSRLLDAYKEENDGLSCDEVVVVGVQTFGFSWKQEEKTWGKSGKPMICIIVYAPVTGKIGVVPRTALHIIDKIRICSTTMLNDTLEDLFEEWCSLSKVSRVDRGHGPLLSSYKTPQWLAKYKEAVVDSADGFLAQHQTQELLRKKREESTSSALVSTSTSPVSISASLTSQPLKPHSRERKPQLPAIAPDTSTVTRAEYLEMVQSVVGLSKSVSSMVEDVKASKPVQGGGLKKADVTEAVKAQVDKLSKQIKSNLDAMKTALLKDIKDIMKTTVDSMKKELKALKTEQTAFLTKQTKGTRSGGASPPDVKAAMKRMEAAVDKTMENLSKKGEAMVAAATGEIETPSQGVETKKRKREEGSTVQAEETAGGEGKIAKADTAELTKLLVSELVEKMKSFPALPPQVPVAASAPAVATPTPALATPTPALSAHPFVTPTPTSSSPGFSPLFHTPTSSLALQHPLPTYPSTSVAYDAAAVARAQAAAAVATPYRRSPSPRRDRRRSTTRSRSRERGRSRDRERSRDRDRSRGRRSRDRRSRSRDRRGSRHR